MLIILFLNSEEDLYVQCEVSSLPSKFFKNLHAKCPTVNKGTRYINRSLKHSMTKPVTTTLNKVQRRGASPSLGIQGREGPGIPFPRK